MPPLPHASYAPGWPRNVAKFYGISLVATLTSTGDGLRPSKLCLLVVDSSSKVISTGVAGFSNWRLGADFISVS